MDDQPQVELFLLADRAEAIGGKLYIFGGLVDEVSIPTVPLIISLGFALSILVPLKMAATGPFELIAQIEFRSPQDGMLAQLTSSVTATKPIPLPGRDTFRIVSAFPALSLEVQEFGLHKAVVRINGHQRVDFPFLVQQTAQ